MLKYNLDENTFENVQETELRAEHIKERHDLQEAIANSWELSKTNWDSPMLSSSGRRSGQITLRRIP